LRGDAIKDANNGGEYPSQEDEGVVEEPFAEEEEAGGGSGEDGEGADCVGD